MTTWMFCRDPFRARRPDEHWAPEAQAAQSRGDAVVYVDHDAWVDGDIVAACRQIDGDLDNVIYRGWMVHPDRYRQLADLLADRGTTLATSADQFQGAHHLPCWWEQLGDHTADSTWTRSDLIVDFDAAVAALGERGATAAVVRDWSKSEKHRWVDAMWIPDLTDLAHAHQVATTFRELRGDRFDGGWVIRNFEHFVGNEARSWWVDGRCVLVGPHPDHPDDDVEFTVDDLSVIAANVAACGFRLSTVDVARDTSGRLRVVELGDGQVSDRPSTTDAALFIDAVS